MTSPESSSKVVNFRSQAAQKLNLALAKVIAEDAQAKLTVHIDTRRFEILREYTNDLNQLLQHEIHMWREVLGARAIKQHELRYFRDTLEPCEITGLVHAMATEFKIEKADHRLVIHPDDARSDILALLKGLGFHQCQFAIEHAQENTLDLLERPIQKARRFQFAKVGVQIKHSEGVENLTRSIQKLYEKFKPDYIYVGCHSHKLTHRDTCNQQTLFENDIQHWQSDYLSLGTEAESEIASHRLDTLADPQRYVAAIQSNRLPINTPDFIKPLIQCPK